MKITKKQGLMDRTVGYTCDVCGKSADDFLRIAQDYGSTGVIFYVCPLDLCQKHMQEYVKFLHAFTGNPFIYLLRRQGTEWSNSEITGVLDIFQDWRNEHHMKDDNKHSEK